MRHYLKKILAVLDGTPSVAGSSTTAQEKGVQGRGQSLVEMTLIMPVLLIMFAGLVEIGWLASDFLILLDVTREAGRFGATSDPMDWVSGQEHNIERMDCDRPGEEVELPARTPLGLFGEIILPPENWDVYLPTGTLPNGLGGFEDGLEQIVGFYDGVACTAIGNMDPLLFDSTQDDIVVSVFAYSVRDNSPHEIVITGRFPARSNECTGETDPFDWDESGAPNGDEDDVRHDYGPDTIRGFVMTGHHEVSDSPGCIGSEFSTNEIEILLNEISDIEKEHFPNNGLLLVEIFWHHDQLLGLPFFTIFGNNFELHVWSIFPSSASEPTATP